MKPFATGVGLAVNGVGGAEGSQVGFVKKALYQGVRRCSPPKSIEIGWASSWSNSMAICSRWSMMMRVRPHCAAWFANCWVRPLRAWSSWKQGLPRMMPLRAQEADALYRMVISVGWELVCGKLRGGLAGEVIYPSRIARVPCPGQFIDQLGSTISRPAC